MPIARFVRPHLPMRFSVSLLLVALLSLGTLVSGASSAAFAHHRPAHGGPGECAGPPTQRPAHCFEEADSDSSDPDLYSVELLLVWHVESDPDGVFSEEAATGELAANPDTGLRDGDTFEVIQTKAGHDDCEITRTVGLGRQTVDAASTDLGVYSHTVTNTVECEEESKPEAPEAPELPIDVDRMFSGNVSEDGFTVPAGEVWAFDPEANTTVEVNANIVVEGTLRMRPSSGDVTHTLRFVGVDESAFRGGHTHHPLETDVGLWVTGDGILDLQGTEREAWNREGDHETWRDDDEIRQAPIAKGDSSNFHEFSVGKEVPSITAPDGTEHATEILNLTRNVTIEGTGDGTASPDNNGRAHIMIMGDKPQTIRHVELRHLGPRQPHDFNPTVGFDGRYPLHFHMMGDAARGSLVEGVVIRQSGHRGFVVHASHGVTLRDTIAFDGFDEQYWWDPDTLSTYPQHASHDVEYERAVAALVKFDPVFRGYGLAGFEFGQGEGNACIECVAVGVQGNAASAGFNWPQAANMLPNSWKFVDSVAHNNRRHGIRAWQNDPDTHLIERFVGYRNGEAGVDHGAYINSYTYRDVVLFDNGGAQVRHHAQIRRHNKSPLRWENLTIVGSVGFETVFHRLAGVEPVQIVGGDWDTEQPIVIRETERDDAAAAAYDFVNVTNRGGDLEPVDLHVESIAEGSVYRVQRTDGTAFQVTAEGVETISPFYGGGVHP